MTNITKQIDRYASLALTIRKRFGYGVTKSGKVLTAMLHLYLQTGKVSVGFGYGATKSGKGLTAMLHLYLQTGKVSVGFGYGATKSGKGLTDLF